MAFLLLLCALLQTKFDIPEESWKFNFLISNKRGMDMKTKIDFAEVSVCFEKCLRDTNTMKILRLVH